MKPFDALREAVGDGKPDDENYKEQQRLQQIDSLRRDWNAPKRHATRHTLESGAFSEWNKRLTALCKLMEKSRGVTIGIIGLRGNGKTQMAVEMMKRRTAELRSARFTSAVQFFSRLKSTYQKDSDKNELDVLMEFQKPSLLVIDEVSKRAETEWQNTMLFELLNCRYNDLKDTILIDNNTMQAFSQSVGPSLASRITEGGGFIDCNWETFRESVDPFTPVTPQ